MVMIARPKATAMLFRTSYHDHTSASIFDRPVERKYDNLNLGLILIFRKVGHPERSFGAWLPVAVTTSDHHNRETVRNPLIINHQRVTHQYAASRSVELHDKMNGLQTQATKTPQGKAVKYEAK